MKTIKLDIDKKTIALEQVERIDWCIAFFNLDIIDIRTRKSQSGNNHIELDLLNDINDYELVFLQLAMQSDFKRECFNLLRVSSEAFSNQSWNVLFRKKFRIALNYKTAKKQIKSNTMVRKSLQKQ